MNGTKPALTSLSVWGIIFAAISTGFPSLAAYFHLTDPATQSSIISIISGVGNVAGLAMALYGRLTATKTISGVISSTPGSLPPLPPAATNIIVAMVIIGVAGMGMVGLSGCANLSAAVNSPLAQIAITEAVNAAAQKNPAATSDARMAVEKAFVLATDGLEAAVQSGVLTGSTNLGNAKADLKTAYGLITAGRNAFLLAGQTPSAALLAEQQTADDDYTRVVGELGAS